jgi:NADPH-dependent 2,4-dienoyl-CoA reductase/sulfur reductase-like enzyme/rhodanese-related sulfurtransferase
MKILIIGGVAGGASAATRLRRNLEDAEIIMVERGPEVSFANCGLPYYLGGVIEERDQLLVTTPEKLRERFRLDVRTLTSAESIDREAKTVSLRDLKSDSVYEESYDYLILATGAAPIRPSMQGLDLPGVFSLRSMQDTDRIFAKLGDVKRAVVVGAGFIGLEMVENLRHRDIEVDLVELSSQVLPPFDPEMTYPLEEALKANQVTLHLGDSLTSIEPGLQVHLQSGKTWKADLVLLGIGVRPENSLAVQAGLAVGPRGGVVVNEQMQTADPSIYAVGDLVQTFDAISLKPTQIPLAGPANRQGRIAADCIASKKASYRGTQGTAIVGLFNQVAAATGASEKALRGQNVPFAKVYVHPNQHAGYYPGAKSLTLKVLFQPSDGKLLGAQAVGEDGVDKRIDAIAVAIQGGLTVYDLEEMELCYAPPFGSAKDPVNMAGFVAANMLRGDHPQLSVEDLTAEMTIVDVRTHTEYAAGHIPGARHIPLDNLRERLDEVSSENEVIVYCQVGLRGYLASRILLQKGFKVRNLSGGYKTFVMFGKPALK